MSVQWYFRRIRRTISLMYECRKGILLANRQLVADFVSSRQVSWVEDFLSGLRDIDQWDNTDWVSDVMFLKFKDYVIENEQKMERGLRGVKYVIDEANTLRIVAGDGRPEKVSGGAPCLCHTIKRLMFACDRFSTSCPSSISFSEEASTL